MTTIFTFNAKREFRDQGLHIEVFNGVLSEEGSDKLMADLLSNSPWRDSFTTKNGKVSLRRNKCIFGSIPYYTAVFRGKTSVSKVHSWKAMPQLEELATMVGETFGELLNTCVLQYYANEKVGINPHRDKEVGRSNAIISLSVGDTRIMRFERNGVIHDIPLPKGSVCVIYAPTNEKWAHSILTEDQPKQPRISVVFRYHPST